jgi:dTDP-glucose 4,6-dehydratase
LLHSDEKEPVNIGNPYEMTILEFAEAVLELTRSSSKIVHIEPEDDRTTDDPKVRRPDITKAREKLGWEPKVALPDGLAPTIDYFRDRII